MANTATWPWRPAQIQDRRGAESPVDDRPVESVLRRRLRLTTTTTRSRSGAVGLTQRSRTRNRSAPGFARGRRRSVSSEDRARSCRGRRGRRDRRRVRDDHGDGRDRHSVPRCRRRCCRRRRSRWGRSPCSRSCPSPARPDRSRRHRRALRSRRHRRRRPRSSRRARRAADHTRSGVRDRDRGRRVMSIDDDGQPGLFEGPQQCVDGLDVIAEDAVGDRVVVARLRVALVRPALVRPLAGLYGVAHAPVLRKTDCQPVGPDAPPAARSARS